MRLVGVFTWNGRLPSDEEVGADRQKQYSTDFGEQWAYQATEPVANAILDAVSMSGRASVVEPPFYADHYWHSTIRIGQRDYVITVQWLNEYDGRHIFGVQPFAARGCFAAMFSLRPDNRLALPARQLLEAALINNPLFADFKWLDERELRDRPPT